MCGVNGASLLVAEFLASSAVGLPAAASGVQLFGALVPMLHVHELSGWLISVLLPISARSGTVIPFDAVVAFAVAALAVLSAGAFTAPLHPSGQARRL